MRHALLPVALMLSGCGESVLVDEKNVTVAQVAAAAAKAQMPTTHPGRWESKVTLGDFNSAAFEGMIFAGLWDVGSLSATVLTCVTPDSKARADMAMLQKVGRDCSFDRFQMGATTLSGQLTCKPSASKRVYVSVDGTHSPDHFQLYFKVDAPGKTAKSERIHYSTAINSIRNGECRGNEDIAAAPVLADIPSAL